MAEDLHPGDFLVFQIESGYGLLRVLEIDESSPADPVWHLAAFRDLFMDVDMAEAALASPGGLQVQLQHVALTNRAFESTQVARISNAPVTAVEADALERWKADPQREVHDRSIRLLLGLR